MGDHPAYEELPAGTWGHLVPEQVRRFGAMLPLPFTLMLADGRTRWANQAYCEMLGLSHRQVLARELDEALHPDDAAITRGALEELGDGRTVHLDLRIRHRDGHHLRSRFALRHDAEIDLVYAVAQDLTDEHRRAEALRHDATHDHLTGAANRAHVMAVLGRWLATGQPVTAVIVDVDRFKAINDRMGHALGDRVLEGVAEDLMTCAGPAAVVGRLGGDEFVVVARGLDDEGVRGLLARLDRLNAEVVVDGRRLHRRVALGAATATGTDPDVLLRRADVAVYAAKHAGTGATRTYDPLLSADDDRRRALEGQVRTALRTGHIQADLQPVVRLADDAVVGVEALARLQRGHDRVAAGAFLPAADRLGLVAPVSGLVRRDALAAVARMPEDVALFINLDAEDLVLAGAFQQLADMAADHGVDARRLVLEVTEVLVMADAPAARAHLAVARELGMRIAIDDFGVGSSTLGQLGALDVDALKVDRSVLHAARAGGNGEVVLRHVIAMAVEMGIHTIVEGIETASDLALARRLGVDCGQGWHLGMPAPASATPTGAAPPAR